MNVFKKSALSLAVSGVVCGVVVTPADAVTVEAGQSKFAARHDVSGVTVTDKVANATDTVTVSGDIYSSGSTNNAFTVDTGNGYELDESTPEGGALKVNVIINGALNGALDAAAGTATTGNGLVITGANALEGNVTINSNITGSAKGVASASPITGNVINNSTITVTGGADTDVAVELGPIGATGQTTEAAFTNSGTINGDEGTGVSLTGAVTGVFENASGATISGKSAAFKSNQDVTLNNSGTITGSIIATTNDITLNNNAGGSIAAGEVTLVAGELTNGEAGKTASLVSTGAVTTTGSVDNYGSIIIGDDEAAGVTGSSFGATTNLGSITVKKGNSGTAGALATGILKNGSDTNTTASINVAGLLSPTGNSENYGSITAGSFTTGGTFVNGKAAVAGPPAVAAITSSTVNVAEAFTAGGAVTNHGVFNAGSAGFDNNAFDNKHMASLGVMTSTGAVTNSGTLEVDEGSTALSYNGVGGTLELNVTTTEKSDPVGTPEILLAVSGSGSKVTLDKNSIIKVTVSDDVLKNVGVIKAGPVGSTLLSSTDLEYVTYDSDGVAQAAADFDGTNAAHTVSVMSDSILLSVSDVRVDDGTNGVADSVTAVLTVMSAGDALGSDSSSAAKSLASDFQNATGEELVITGVYGTLADSSSSTTAMSTYLDKIRPDDSNSSASSVATMTTAAMGNISNRAAAKRGGSFGDMMQSGSFWVQALTGKGEQDAADGTLGYDTKLTGFTFGVDTDWDKGTTGFAFSYGNTDVDFAGSRNQSEEIKSYVGSIYHNWQRGNMFVDASLSYGKSKHEMERMGGTARVKGDYDSSQIGAQVFVGMTHAMGEAVLEPKVGFRGTWVNTDDYTAKNSAGTLEEKVGDISYKKLELGLGASLSRAFEMDNGSVRPSAGFMYFHDTANEKLDNTVTFAGNTYAIEGNSPERGSWEARLGLDMMSDNDLTFSVDYTRVKKDDFKSDNFAARLKYDF